MHTTTQFDGTTQVRGRNGWFSLALATSFTDTAGQEQGIPATASLCFYSAGSWKQAPCGIEFRSATEVRRLADDLTAMASAMEAGAHKPQQ